MLTYYTIIFTVNRITLSVYRLSEAIPAHALHLRCTYNSKREILRLEFTGDK